MLPWDQNLVFVAASRVHSAAEVCALLVNRHADPTAVDSLLVQTPLFFAVRNSPQAGGPECARYLLLQCCEANHCDAHGQTPLFYAAQRADHECAEAMTAAGADVSLADARGQTAAFYAARAGAVACLRVLLAAGYSVSFEDAGGQTALFHASSPAIVELLVNEKCDANHQDAQGQTALFSAARAGADEVLRALVVHGGDVHAVDHLGETCLFQAVQARDAARVCRALIEEFGADATHANGKGMAAAVKDVFLRNAKLGQPHKRPTNSLCSTAPQKQRRKFVLVFDDLRRPGTTIAPDSAEYVAALRELSILCPWLEPQLM
eukprot:NODE_10611_length_1340_cov_2.809563.p1 GENE.NODE_10611_length_1340_cov_2.809563~~NODE_10611_length_1340_cov_2.809563.p1  ORF type:complete len:350 (-),score=111.38 NODE_10611_length_1340_cov_2.809563:289-1251(-)